MKILLINDYIYGAVSNEVTFLSVLSEELSDCQSIALKDFKGNIEEYIKGVSPKVVIFNSILGDIKVPSNVKKIALLQDNFVAMDQKIPKTLRQKISKIIKGRNYFYSLSIKKQKEAINNSDITVAVSQDVAISYNTDAKVIPIGVDSELFKPLDKEELRIKYQIPKRFVKIFVGSTSLVKGFDILEKEIQKDKRCFYILVFKDKKIPSRFYRWTNVKIFQRVSQCTLAELYNCSDIFIGKSRVETLWLAPIETMFCNVPVDITNVGIFADWYPENKNPRQEAFQKGLDKETMIRKWEDLIESIDKDYE